MRRIHPGYLVAVLALVLAGTSAGFAAGSLVTSKEIKDKTIKVKDISPKARAKLRGQTGPAGPQGVIGAQGPRGFSAWDTIPSGTLVAGGWDVDGADGFTSQAVVSLPGRAPVPIDQAHLVLWGSAVCSGTPFAPDPQPGYVCVSQLGSMHKGSGGGPLVAASAFSAPDRGFVLELTNVTGDTAFSAHGVWAYRAP